MSVLHGACERLAKSLVAIIYLTLTVGKATPR